MVSYRHEWLTNMYTYYKGPKNDISDIDDSCAPKEAVIYAFPIREKCRIYIVAEFP